MKPKVIAILLMVLCACLVASCGGGSDAPRLTKAALIKQGDKLCGKTDEEQNSGIQSYTAQHGGSLKSKAGVEKVVITAALPPIKGELEGLATLRPPEADEAKIDAIVQSAEEALTWAEGHPLSVEEGPGNPFNEANKLAKAYGFTVCSNLA